MSGAQIILYCLIFCSAVLAMQFGIGAGKQIRARVKHANARQKQLQKSEDPAQMMARMRKDRSLGEDGRLKSLNRKIGKMVVQSGLPLGQHGIYGLMAAGLVMGGAATFWKTGSLLGALAGALAGCALPLLFLKMQIKRRRNKAVGQLPDALDIMIRSLRAGHPIPVSIGLVGREMPDPIGSEFGIVSDEIVFGSTVSTAIQRMAERIGQEDFDLMAAMIRLQERTGGNLIELLASNARTIRERQKMRLKIKALSAEGRMSALILTAAPFILYGFVRMVAPDFYGEVENNPLVRQGFIAIGVWMLIGNLIMRKMINFKV